MSAHVFANEIAQHLDEGMDAFVGKPVSPEGLAQALAEVLCRDGAARFSSTELACCDDEQLADFTVLHDDYLLLGPERTGRMVEAFLNSAPRQIDDLQQAVGVADWSQVAQLAHSLRSSAGSLGLSALESRSRGLETAANSGDGAVVTSGFAAYPATFEDPERHCAKPGRG